MSAMTYACQSKHPGVIAAILGKGGLSPNHTYSSTSPLSTALNSGHLEAVQAVLDAGADIRSNVYRNSLMPLTPIELVLKKGANEDILRLLCKRGAALPASQSWPRSRKNVHDILRDEKMKREGVYVSTFAEAAKARRTKRIPRMRCS
ncbi:hypothetical protein CC80DRAFT_546442 [Byssothecium circinans]|uniref:Uncharacterized protein n=1 Tax=Byssothecium circinans TaxID=147558 RepID=A0A6A5U2Z2_9PLEO|nr:hypothetical protein CC80DRAFT_546442 [Byssothecium circinans]